MTTPPLEPSLNGAGPRRSVGSRRRAGDHFSPLAVTVAFAVGHAVEYLAAKAASARNQSSPSFSRQPAREAFRGR
jgi:hypothetical protein